jgi:hypothetical protein
MSTALLRVFRHSRNHREAHVTFFRAMLHLQTVAAQTANFNIDR